MNEVQGVARLLEYQDAFTKDPAGYVRFVVERAGLDPRQVFPQLAGAQPGRTQPSTTARPAAQPHPAERQVRELNGKVNTIAGWIKAQAEGQAGGVLERFQTEKDETGNLKHPHVERLAAEMEQLLNSHPALSQQAVGDPTERLRKAYQLALLADPELSNEHVDGEVRRREADRLRQADVDRAKRARPVVRAATTPVRSSGGRPATLDEAINQATSKLGL